MSLRITSSEKLNLVSNMSTMLSAGIPVGEVVESLLEESKGNQQKMLQRLHQDLQAGKTLSDSFGKFPDVFDVAVVNVIRSAEEGGNLETTLKDVVHDTKKQIEFNEKVVSALTYPALVMIVFVAVILVILTFVVPRIAVVFSRLNVQLPVTTKILIAVSTFLSTYTLFIGLFFVLLTVAIVFLFRTRRKMLTKFLYSLPLIRSLGREIDLTRFTRSFSLLLKSGIPIGEALELSQQVVSQNSVAAAIETCRDMVTNGKTLTAGMQASPTIFPLMMRKIVSAGEKSGTLVESMQEQTEYFDARVSRNLKTLTTLLEPVMLVVVGLLVGGMMLAIIAPIYGLIGQITPG